MTKLIDPKAMYWGSTVVLLSTVNTQGETNITPISSSWSLGKSVVIGLSLSGKALENLENNGEAVLNVASSELVDKVEKIARFTGKFPVPPDKESGGFLFSADKFAIGEFTREPALDVRPARIKECHLQVECRVQEIRRREGFAIVELQAIHLHADEFILKNSERIDASRWYPLIYNFRSYHGITGSLGKNFKFNN